MMSTDYRPLSSKRSESSLRNCKRLTASNQDGFFNLVLSAAHLRILLILAVVALTASCSKSVEMPCIKEICLGDGLEKLQGISWEPMPNMGYTYDASVVAKWGYNQKAEKIINWLAAGRFDAQTLPLLGGITWCGPNYAPNSDLDSSLKGKFKSESGHDTTVYIKLIPSANNPAEQNWKVVAIGRSYRYSSNEQREQLENDLRKQYDAVLSMQDQEHPEKVPVIAQLTSSPQLFFQLNPLPTRADYQKHPACAQSKVGLD